MKILFTLLMFSVSAAAQIQMTYSYSSYVNQSADQSDIYETAVVDGTATCYPTNNEFNPCSAVVHTPSVYVQLDIVSGWNVGNGVSPQTYISEANAKTLTNAVPGVMYSENNTEKVICSFAGAVFLFQESPGALIGIRWSSYKFQAYLPPPANKCVWNAFNCIGTCSVGQYSSTLIGSSCTQGANIYQQCWDAVVNTGFGVKCVTHHAFCIHQPVPGVCN